MSSLFQRNKRRASSGDVREHFFQILGRQVTLVETSQARTCERFAYFIVKITRLYDYQTWQTHFWRNARGTQRYMGFVFLIVLFGCWLAGQANPDHVAIQPALFLLFPLSFFCAVFLYVVHDDPSLANQRERFVCLFVCLFVGVVVVVVGVCVWGELCLSLQDWFQ